MEKITKTSIIINEIKIAIERDENALKYQADELRELKEKAFAIEQEIKRSKEVIKLEKEILAEYETK